ARERQTSGWQLFGQDVQQRRLSCRILSETGCANRRIESPRSEVPSPKSKQESAGVKESGDQLPIPKRRLPAWFLRPPRQIRPGARSPSGGLRRPDQGDRELSRLWPEEISRKVRELDEGLTIKSGLFWLRFEPERFKRKVPRF